MLEGKKTLKDFLEAPNIEDFNTIRIGTKDGSGWLFVGSPTTSNLIQRINSRLKRYNEYRIESAKREIDTLTATVEHYTERKGRLTRTKKSYQAELDSAKKRLERYEDEFKNYIPFGKREVVDFYESEIGDAVLCLIIEGNENGTDTIEWRRGDSKLNISACLRLLECVYTDAAQEYEDAYRLYLRCPHSKKAQERLHKAEHFFKHSPLVDWSGTDGENAMATIRARINSDARIKRLRRNQEAIERWKANKEKAKESKVAEIISKAVDEQEVQLKDVAKRINVSATTLSNYKTGKNNPKKLTPQLKAFAYYLGCLDEIEALYS
jgi:hypothetical protein